MLKQIILLISLLPLTISVSSRENTFNMIGREEGVSPRLLRALCTVESGLKPKAFVRRDGKSSSFGLCQVKRIAAKHVGLYTNDKDLMQPEINLRVAAKFLRLQLDRYKGNVVKALSAYNAGRDISQNTYSERVFNVYAQGAL